MYAMHRSAGGLTSEEVKYILDFTLVGQDFDPDCWERSKPVCDSVSNF